MNVKTYKGLKVPEGATHYSDMTNEFIKHDGQVHYHSITGWVAIPLKYNLSPDMAELPQEPEQFVPKVGEECEMLINSWHPKGEWEKVTPLFIGGQLIVVDIVSAEIAYNAKEMDFRPIKTERKRIEEWVLSKIDCLEDFQLDQAIMITKMLDLGCLVIPESK